MCNAGACSDEHDQTIKSAALGGDHIVLCTQAGTVLSAGLDNFGQSSGRKTSNKGCTIALRPTCGLQSVSVKLVAAGDCHCLALSVDGRVWAWGGNMDGQVGAGGLSRSLGPSLVAGPGAPAGRPSGSATPGATGQAVAHVAAGARHSVAVTAGGGLLCWGSNKHGQCGSAPGTSVPEPTLVGSLGGLCVVHASAGLGHTAACTDSGSVYCWGWNSNGQLGYPGEGIGHIDWQPALVEGRELDEEHVRKVACGSRHTVALCTSGRAYGWGWNEHGQLGLGRSSACQGSASLINVPLTVSDVACGQWHTLLVTDG
uniref:Ultraviolet-b receptor uvr8 n=2 Tax=Tetraselmis sp. GSL018 TaxID=582737 RepID=A0A061RUZ4_9CHLO|mmetsp:Transcript_21427/g.51107  ORF Transcript_21427/g.51107 Transcript_21427/m.51107 type:complete len:314 (+) Transcript_21427:742-1683(+)